MESEGPYTIDTKGEIWWILFDGEKVQTAPKDLVCNSALICSLLNTSYAEGWKAAEKEREQEIKDLRFAIGDSDKDFKELLEMANEMENEMNLSSVRPIMNNAISLYFAKTLDWRSCSKFAAWKKARGIE